MMPILELVQEMMFVNTCVKFRDNGLRNEVCRAMTLFECEQTYVRTGRSLYTLRGYNNQWRNKKITRGLQGHLPPSLSLFLKRRNENCSSSMRTVTPLVHQGLKKRDELLSYSKKVDSGQSQNLISTNVNQNGHAILECVM